MEKFYSIAKPPSGFSFGLKELWQYRELFYFFTWRDIKVKYKQTALGITWAILQPLGLMLLFTFVFSRNWKIETGINYRTLYNRIFNYDYTPERAFSQTVMKTYDHKNHAASIRNKHS